METNRDEVLGEVVYDVFEKLAFMFGEVVDKEEVPQTATAYVRASMTFSGDMAGTIALTVPVEVCPEIAANVLGLDQDDELVAAQAIDALKEVLNVICGNVLTAIAGEKALFDLSVPTVSDLDPEAWTAVVKEPNTHVYLVDDSPVLVQLTCEV